MNAMELPPLSAYEDDAPALSKVTPLRKSSGSGGHPSPEPFEFFSFATADLKPRPYLVQRFIEEQSVVVIVGTPNAGKTAFAIDMALHVALGMTWFGLKVQRAPVLYVAAEAPGSVVMRMRAAMATKMAEGDVAGLYGMSVAPDLGGEGLSAHEALRVIETAKLIGEHWSGGEDPVRMIFIDTLASCLGGGDENGDGMIRLTNAAAYIAQHSGAAVVLVHHPSKADPTGMRGHGSLWGKSDTVISIGTDEVSGIRTATLIKARDAATGQQLAYKLDQHEVPEPDNFGDPRTTIVVTPVGLQTIARKRPKGVAQQRLLDELERQYRTGQTGWSEAQVREAMHMLGMHRNSVPKVLSALTISGYLVGSGAHLTLRYPPDLS